MAFVFFFVCVSPFGTEKKNFNSQLSTVYVVLYRSNIKTKIWKGELPISYI